MSTDWPHEIPRSVSLPSLGHLPALHHIFGREIFLGHVVLTRLGEG
jgi:hypothetical protein